MGASSNEGSNLRKDTVFESEVRHNHRPASVGGWHWVRRTEPLPFILPGTRQHDLIPFRVLQDRHVSFSSVRSVFSVFRPWLRVFAPPRRLSALLFFIYIGILSNGAPAPRTSRGRRVRCARISERNP